MLTDYFVRRCCVWLTVDDAARLACAAAPFRAAPKMRRAALHEDAERIRAAIAALQDVKCIGAQALVSSPRALRHDVQFMRIACALDAECARFIHQEDVYAARAQRRRGERALRLGLGDYRHAPAAVDSAVLVPCV